MNCWGHKYKYLRVGIDAKPVLLFAQYFTRRQG